MQIAINLPNDFVALQPIKEIEQEMRLSYALWLFKNAKVTLSKAAELAALDIYDFLGSVDVSLRKNQRVIVMPPGNGGIQMAGRPSLATGFRQSMPE